MHLECELHAYLLEFIEDRLPALCEILVAILDLVGEIWRETVDEVPDAAAGEAVHNTDAKALGGLRCLDHLFSGALANPFSVAVAIDVVWEDLLVALIDEVAHALTHEMGGNGKAHQTRSLDLLPLG